MVLKLEFEYFYTTYRTIRFVFIWVHTVYVLDKRVLDELLMAYFAFFFDVGRFFNNLFLVTV